MKEARSHAANLATTVASFGVSVVVGLWFTPYLVHSLGAAAYGLIPLATTVVSYFGLLSQSLSAALTRNLSLAVNSEDHEAANRTFGTVLATTLLVCAVLLPPLAAVAAISPRLFQIPAAMDAETRLLFGVVAGGFLMTLIGTCYTAVCFSRNQLYLNNIAALAQSIARVVFTIALFTAAQARVLYAALAILGSTLLGLVLNIAFARRSVPWLKLGRMSIDHGELRIFGRISSHQMVMQFGTVLVMSCELVLVNRLFGEYDGGRYGAVIQWLLLLRNASMALVVLFVPTMLARYADKDIAGLVAVTRRAMRWIGIGFALPVGYLCGLSPQILKVWLGGPEFAELWPVMVVQLAPLVIVSAILPLYTLSLAADKVLTSGLVQCATGVAGILIAIVAVKAFGGGMTAVAAAVGWTLLAKELVFMPFYTASNIGERGRVFYPPLVPGLVLFALTLAAAAAAGRWLLLDSYLDLALAGAGMTCLFAIAAVAMVPAEDRALLSKGMSRLRPRRAQG